MAMRLPLGSPRGDELPGFGMVADSTFAVKDLCGSAAVRSGKVLVQYLTPREFWLWAPSGRKEWWT